MKINLEILASAHLYDEQSVPKLNTKELVPKMMLRRRLTQSSKVIIELMDKVQFKQGRIIFGTAYGELKATSNILNAIANNELLSPTDFQNSVYNTPISYASILFGNKHEVLTVSSGEKTSLNTLKAGAVKALDGDEILLVCAETININDIEQVNSCIEYLESAVALKVKITNEPETIDFLNRKNKGFPKSLNEMISIAKACQENEKNIVGIQL